MGLTRAARFAVAARCPGRRSGPAAILHARVQAPAPRGTLPNIASIVMRLGALRSSAPAIHGFATPLRFNAALCRRMAKLSKAKPSRLMTVP